MLGTMVDALAGAMFVGFCTVQFDDPDTATWVALYGGAAATSFLSAWGAKSTVRWAALAQFGLYATVSVASLPNFSEPIYQQERTWESSGMALAALWMGVLWYRAWRLRGAPPD